MGGEFWSPQQPYRTIRVAAMPPEVQLALQPAWPDGHNGWYVTPVTVVVSATETLGSGGQRRGEHRRHGLAAVLRAAVSTRTRPA